VRENEGEERRGRERRERKVERYFKERRMRKW